MGGRTSSADRYLPLTRQIGAGSVRLFVFNRKENIMKRGKKYQAAAAKINQEVTYPLPDAILLLKETVTTKFDATVEVHLRLGIDPKKGDQQVRGTLTLPHSFGQAKRIAVFAGPEDQAKARAAGAAVVGGEELITAIKQTGKIDFDIAIATPEMMKPLAQVAKILGPKGLMPSPKAETVTTAVAKTIAELGQGKITFKNDAAGNVHLAVGKVSQSADNLQQNIEAFLAAIKTAKPENSKGTYILNMSLASSMGPGIKFKLV